jgi:hypothetical protein
MPRGVLLRRAAGAALTLAVALAAPAAARAESIAVTPGADPVAGMPSGIDYEYDTGAVPLNLTVIARPAAGPPCAATQTIDAAEVGASGGTAYVTPTPIALQGRGLGRVPFTYPSAGRFRVCAWLARSPDDVAATGAGEADVRLPRASLTVVAQQDAPKAGGSGLLVEVKGTTEGADDVLVTAVSAATGCPPSYDEDTGPRTFDVIPAGTPTRVTGDFDLRFTAHDLLSYRAWRICAFLQDGTTAPAASATGSALVDLLLRPQLLRRPRVTIKGATAMCDGGRWKARPAARLAYAWLAGGRPVAGATGRRLALGAALRGRAITCRVTATNRAGTAHAASRAVTTPR